MRPINIRPLDRETRAAITTREAAWHLHCHPDTLRRWACTQTGRIKPVRVGGHLRWPVEELRQLVGMAA